MHKLFTNQLIVFIHYKTLNHFLVILKRIDNAINWIRLTKNSGLTGSWNSETRISGGGEGGNITCKPKNRVMKTFWMSIKDVKYKRPMVNPDFICL